MKKIWFLILFLIFSVISISSADSSWANFEDFTLKLDALGINVASLRIQDKLSRYQLTRLLNAVECHDCVLPTQETINHFNQPFWQNFTTLPGKDFRDIPFGNAKHNSTNYYYCVAYAGEQNYMRGYPLQTSPFCSGNFCGQRSISKGEFYQTLVNLIGTRVAPRYTIPRKEIKNWLQKMDSSKYEFRTFDSEEIKLINSSTATSTPARSSQELNLYLKYCMFNTAECGFRNFNKIKSGIWPIAQMNLLIKEGIITPDDTDQISSPISPEQALQMLYQVYHLHTQCDFNADYDCDGIKNSQDNCPYSYNPSQADLDNDAIGDVCDPDIDGDGESNPIGFVDDTWNINFALLYGKKLQDKTPLWPEQQDQYHFLIIDSISQTPPYTIKAHIQSKSQPSKIEWDFDDGSHSQGLKASHIYEQWGIFTIRAKITEKNWMSRLISTQIQIPETGQNHFLSLNQVLINGNKATITADAIWPFDRYEWTNSATKQKQTSSQLSAFSPSLLTWVRNNITLKAYQAGKLLAFASTDIRELNGKFVNAHLQIQPQTYTLNQNITPILRLSSLSLSNIATTERDFWDQTIENEKNLTPSHRYTIAGGYSLIQKTKLNNGQFLISTASLALADSKKTMPQAVNLYFLSLNEKNLKLRLQPLFPTPQITKANLQFSPLENISKENISVGETIFYQIGQEGSLNIKSSYQLGNTILKSESVVSTSRSSLNNITLDEKTMYSGLKCDMDKQGVPDKYDIDIDGDGIPNLLGLIKYEKSDCSLIPGENVNQNLYQQHFGVCALDNCPFVYNKDQADLNNNGIWDVCEELTPKCWDGKIDEEESCLSCPQDVWECTSICGNGKIEPWETCKNCPQDVGECSAFCGNGKIEPWETCKTCPQDVGECSAFCGNGKRESAENCTNCPTDVPICSSSCGNGKIDPGEACDDGKQNGKNKKCSLACTLTNSPSPLCWNGKIDLWETCLTCQADLKGICITLANQNLCGNGKIDQGETCKNCPQDVQRCFSLCGNGIVETHLGEECDEGSQNGQGKCSKTCTLTNLCGNGKIDSGETCISCPQDVKTCDIDGDKIPDPIDECPNIPGPINNGGCPTPPIQCQGENCALVLPNCNKCPCEYADFSNTLHQNDKVRAKLRDLPTNSHYNFSDFAPLSNFISP